MKKSVVLAIVGLGMAAATTTAFAQGGVSISNYVGPFNPVVWSPTLGGGGVSSTEGVNLTLWYGSGTIADASLLTTSMPLTWNALSEASGYLGYYGPDTAVLNGWAVGQTWTFQVRASGDSSRGVVDSVASRSVLWQENSNIADISGNPPGLPGSSTQSIGLTVSVPEPTTLALAGLGLAALMTFRRRS